VRHGIKIKEGINIIISYVKARRTTFLITNQHLIISTTFTTTFIGLHCTIEQFKQSSESTQ